MTLDKDLRVDLEFEWQVKGVIYSRKKARNFEYLVDWEGNWEPTGEPLPRIQIGHGILLAIEAFPKSCPHKPKPAAVTLADPTLKKSGKKIESVEIGRILGHGIEGGHHWKKVYKHWFED